MWSCVFASDCLGIIISKQPLAERKRKKEREKERQRGRKNGRQKGREREKERGIGREIGRIFNTLDQDLRLVRHFPLFFPGIYQTASEALPFCGNASLSRAQLLKYGQCQADRTSDLETSCFDSCSSACSSFL